MTDAWTVHIEHGARRTEDGLDALGEALEAYHSAVRRSPSGSTSVTMTLPAESALDATRLAHEVLAPHSLTSDGVTVIEVIDEHGAERLRAQVRSAVVVRPAHPPAQLGQRDQVQGDVLLPDGGVQQWWPGARAHPPAPRRCPSTLLHRAARQGGCVVVDEGGSR